MTNRARFDNPEIISPKLSATQLRKMLSLQGEMLQQAVIRSDYHQLLDELCLMAESFTPNAVAAIMLYDPDRDALFVKNGPSLSPEATEAFNGLRSGDGSCGNAVYHNEAMYVCNTLEDARWSRMIDVASRFNIASCFSFPILDKDGEAIGSFSISSFEPREPSGFHRALLETCTGICSVVLQRRADEEVRERLLEEQIKAERVDGLGVLAGGIAHDFNNLLTSIMGNVDLTQSALPVGPEQENLQLAIKAIESASELTRQLLTISKGGSPICVPNDIGSIIRDSAEFALVGSNVSYDLVGLETLPSPVVNVDGGQIGQLIQNLVINARHAMPGGGNIRIGCSLTEGADHIALNDGKYLRITVADSGEGVEKSALTHLFEPYFTTREDGNGLGLFLCYSISKRHEGHIEVSSEVGKGTCFTTYLPWSECDANGIEVGKAEQKSAVQAKVLIMDDDRLVRRTLGRMLEQLGCKSEETSNGRDAVACYKQHLDEGKPFDVTILDLTVPGGMGGLEAMKQIRECDPTAKVVVSTGYSADETCVNYKSAGFDEAMLKPYRIDKLKTVLGTVVL